jgi:AcrR family transcriptional regulator
MTRRKNQDATAGPAAWPPPVKRRGITRDGVIARALDILEENGFDGLTMRRLAERLGIKAASLYNHVHDKNELLALMADAISAAIPDINPSGPWRREVERMSVEVRRTLMARRDGARVLAATFPNGPHRLRLIEQILRTFRQAGFSRGQAADLTYILNSYVVGFVLDETSAGPTDGDDAARMREAGRAWFKGLPATDYPTIVALADQLVDSPADRRFMLGLRALLDGFDARRKKDVKLTRRVVSRK